MYECIWLNLPLLTFWLIYYPHPPYFIIMTAYSDHRGDHIWSYQWSHHLAFILRHRGWKGQGYPGGAIALHDDTKSSRIVAQLYEFEYFLTFGHPAPGMSPSIESSVVNLFTFRKQKVNTHRSSSYRMTHHHINDTKPYTSTQITCRQQPRMLSS
jgi:hypothetical protein